MTALLPLVLALAAGAGPRSSQFEVEFLYRLATSFGELPLTDVRLSWDAEHRELYVTGAGPVRVFNTSGMQVYAFGNSPELGTVRTIASAGDGVLVAFAYYAGRLALVRCDFRGEFLDEIVPRNVPQPFASMRPTLMRYHDGKIYLVDQGAMRIVVLDLAGEYVASYDVAEKLGEAEHRAELGIRGFSVDGDGNILFTIQPLFSAYTMSPDGRIRPFGQRGSAPGKFNVVSGIARDDAGYYYVADVLKSAIIVFDPGFAFVKEFGYRGPKGLAAPEDVVAADGRVFVGNRGKKGVSVFRVGLR
jgi:hypothetical protein